MASPRPNQAFLMLQRMQKAKQFAPPRVEKIGHDMVNFFKHNVEKRQKNLGKIGEAWATMIPENLMEHSCIESITRGTLTVLVDSSSHLYLLRQLLLSGLEKQLITVCKKEKLRKISLKPGRWYDGDKAQDRKFDF